MSYIIYISNLFIPVMILLIIGYGLYKKAPVFQLFLDGVTQGFQIVLEIAPTILGLFIAIGAFRSSGALELLCKLLEPLATLFHLPTPVIPLSILKLFSSSGANTLLFDIFKTYGTDSYIGFTSCLLLCCTETLFYTFSLYLTRINIKKTRWLIPAGLVISVISLLASSIIAFYYTS